VQEQLGFMLEQTYFVWLGVGSDYLKLRIDLLEK